MREEKKKGGENEKGRRQFSVPTARPLPPSARGGSRGRGASFSFLPSRNVCISPSFLMIGAKKDRNHIGRKERGRRKSAQPRLDTGAGDRCDLSSGELRYRCRFPAVASE